MSSQQQSERVELCQACGMMKGNDCTYQTSHNTYHEHIIKCNYIADFCHCFMMKKYGVAEHVHIPEMRAIKRRADIAKKQILQPSSPTLPSPPPGFSSPYAVPPNFSPYPPPPQQSSVPPMRPCSPFQQPTTIIQTPSNDSTTAALMNMITALQNDLNSCKQSISILQNEVHDLQGENKGLKSQVEDLMNKKFSKRNGQSYSHGGSAVSKNANNSNNSQTSRGPIVPPKSENPASKTMVNVSNAPKAEEKKQNTPKKPYNNRKFKDSKPSNSQVDAVVSIPSNQNVNSISSASSYIPKYALQNGVSPSMINPLMASDIVDVMNNNQQNSVSPQPTLPQAAPQMTKEDYEALLYDTL